MVGVQFYLSPGPKQATEQLENRSDVNGRWTYSSAYRTRQWASVSTLSAVPVMDALAVEGVGAAFHKYSFSVVNGCEADCTLLVQGPQGGRWRRNIHAYLTGRHAGSYSGWLIFINMVAIVSANGLRENQLYDSGRGRGAPTQQHTHALPFTLRAPICLSW